MGRSTTTVDDALREVFELGQTELDAAMTIKGNMPNALFGRFLRVIDSSGALERLDEWRTADAAGSAGRKAQLSYRTVLMAFLLNSYWGLGYSYQELARTITHRLSAEQAERLGFDRSQGDVDDWYHRAWRTMQRVLGHIDPWHQTGHLGTRLTGAENEKARNKYDLDREHRAHELSALLVRASVEMLPKKYLSEYRGDVALDSTFMRVLGFNNPNDYSKKALKERAHLPKRDMLNGDYQCGWYTRKGDHDGSENVSKSIPGYEADTTVLIDTKDGAFAFPLITGLSFHRPGEIKNGPRGTIEQHAAFTDKRGLVVVDRAFNGLRPHQFQETVRHHRFETVYDYKSNELGNQGSVPGKPIIIVDGVPYVNRMPENYIMISRWHAQGKENPATGVPFTEAERDAIHEARAPYRLKAKGRIGADGYQRFDYPNPRSYFAFDPVTGRATQDNPTGSVTIGLDEQVIKQLQKYPWKSKEWRARYGQRNQVEMSNRLLKDHRTENLGDPKARTGRGFAYNYLAAIMATVSSNIRRIIVGITKLHTTDANGEPKKRARKRRDSTGQRLTHAATPTSTNEAVMPPDDTGE
ncbi:hypothetical protein [Leucobacter sp. cx-169]|uniref:hypothetical protein n=1 Tax=Leucobacter sp. cx-169 TaxID=2770549 RepID=UPI00165E4866|nr:hypothetical protein [Leucobacter sp. cx-169]MBC9926959.1 hypothetical protein [Leucobacter sp. cx-169]